MVTESEIGRVASDARRGEYLTTKAVQIITLPRSLLVKEKRLAKTTPIPCIVRDAASDILAEDNSLAGNLQRFALDPFYQFRAFVSLPDKGQTDAA
jgi:hypothetical protein